MMRINVQAASQATVYTPNDQYYVYSNGNLPNVMFPDQPVAVSINVLVTSLSGVKLLPFCGYSRNSTDRLWSAEIEHTKRTVVFYLRSSTTEIKKYESTAQIPDVTEAAWVNITYGWDGANAFIEIDGDRQNWQHDNMPLAADVNTNDQRYGFGGSNFDTHDGWQYYDVVISQNNGLHKVRYHCETAVGGVCANSEPSTGSAFDLPVIALSGDPADIAQAPAIAIPEPQPPQPGENVFTATSNDPNVTHWEWECKPDSIPDDEWYPASQILSNYIAVNNTLEIVSSRGSESGLIRPVAFSPTWVDGYPADVPARLTVYDEEAPEPEVPTSQQTRIFFSDMTSGANRGWLSDADDTNGQIITIWGVGFGTEGSQGADFVQVNSNGSSVQPTTYFGTWAEYGKPIPWLQSITFQLHSGMQPDDNGTVQISVGGEMSNTIPLGIRTDGRCRFIDVAQPDNSGTGEHDSPHKDITVIDDDLRGGDVVYFRQATIDYSLSNSTRYGVYIRDSVTAGSERAPIGLMSYPGETFTWNSPGDAEVKKKLDVGFHIVTEWITVSRMHINALVRGIRCQGTHVGLTENTRGGYCRMVGNDVVGCQHYDQGTAPISAGGSGQFSGIGFRGYNASGHKALGNAVHGARSMHRLDHAIYFGGDPYEVGQEIAYNYVYDMHVGGGNLIQTNHQSPRVWPGHRVQELRIHHNFVDARTPQGIYPPTHDPSWTDPPSPSYYDDVVDTYASIGIGTASDGVEGAGGPSSAVKSGERPQVHHNIVLGHVEQQKPGITSPALYMNAATSGADVYHNWFADFGMQVWTATGMRRNTETDSAAPMTFINNIFTRSTQPTEHSDGSYGVLTNQYDNNGVPTTGSKWNIMHGGKGGDPATVPESTVFGAYVIEEDPNIDIDLSGAIFKFTLGAGPAVDKAFMPVPNTLFDFNGLLYGTQPIDIGAVEYLSSSTPNDGILLQMDFSTAPLGSVTTTVNGSNWHKIPEGETDDPANDVLRLPGVDMIRMNLASELDVAHQVEIVDGAAYGTTGNVLVVKEGIEYANLGRDMNISMHSHLTGDSTVGYEELFVRYHFRFPDNLRWGDQLSEPDDRYGYWKWFRYRQNVIPGDEESVNKEERQVFMQANGGHNYESRGEPGWHLNNDTNEPLGSAGNPDFPGSVTAKFRVHSDSPDFPLEDPTGNVGSIQSFVKSTFDRTNEIGFLNNRAQTFHTLEVRIKLATGKDTYDGIWQVWVDGVEQRVPRQTQPEKGWDTQDSNIYTDDAWYAANIDPIKESVGIITAGKNVSHQGIPNSGMNGMHIFDNLKNATQFWHNWPEGPPENQDGGRIFKDIVISTKRIGHTDQYQVSESLDNRPHKQSQAEGNDNG